MIAGVGCKKNYLDINTNPNSATNTTPELVLPNALNVTAARQITNYTFISGWMGYWAVSGSYALNTSDFSTYKQTTDFGTGLWSAIYDNLEDYDYIEKAGASQNKPFYEAAGKIMKAYNFQQLVDMFGDVPYTTAFQGTAQIQPVYDNAQDVYDSLVANLDLALDLMARSDAEGEADFHSDFLFQGNTTAWRQFANTLKLRILMRQSQIGRDSYIQGEIAKITADGSGFLDQDAAVDPGYVNTDGKMNPFYDFCFNSSGTYTQDFWRANQYYIDFCVANNDPRYMYVYQPAQSTGEYAGNYLGQATGALVGSASSRFGPGVLKGYDQPAVIMLAAESYFLQAEASIRGWLSVDAGEAYKAGVQASFDFYGVGDATEYLSQTGNPNVSWSDGQTFNYKLALIIRQKWAAMNTTTPFEAWADYRRLHLPANIPLSQSPYVDVAVIPYRIIYPTIEYQTNAANVPDQADGAQYSEKIFWMP